MNGVWLVAQREITVRARSKAFLISTLVLTLGLVAVSIVTKLIGDSGSDFTVGVTSATSSLAAPLQASATSAGQTVSARTVPDESTGRAEVASGDLDALLVGDGSDVRVVVKQNLDTKLGNVLRVLAGQVAFRQEIERLGGDPAAVSAAVAHAPVTVTSVKPPHTFDAQQIALGSIAGILVYIALMFSGTSVAQGVVEEKSSRVVELLLATLRPWQLMAGKVLGLGIVGLAQVVVIGGVGLLVGLRTGSLTIAGSAAATTILWLIAWFLLGFFAYALALAAAAALVSRQEDVGTVMMPVLMPVILGYVLGISIVPNNPGSGLIRTLSMLPVFAPTLMPMRVALGGVPAWQLAVAVAGMVVVIPLLVLLSARIYRNAVLRTGARVRLRDALRAA